MKRAGDSRVKTAGPHPELTVNKVSNNFKREGNFIAAGIRFTEK